MPLETGQVFAGYTIVRLVGTGGMGEVYLAQHPRLPRRDALKVLPASFSADDGYRHRFSREADLAATLWHPHIVGVHDRGEYDGRLWISMDFVDGHDAARLLVDRYPNGLPAADVIEIVTAVADALDYAHQRHLLHRDVKPANVLVTGPDRAGRRILLTDFGIARHAEDNTGLTSSNIAVGSMSYSAPEQLMGHPIDGRADQYSLAATTHRLFTGSPPFPHSNPAVIISHHLNTPPPRLGDTRPELRAFDAAMTRALAKDPAARFGCCHDFAVALAQAAGPLAAPPPVLVSPWMPSGALYPGAQYGPAQGQPPPRRRRLIVAGAVLAVILLVAAVVSVVAVRSSDADSTPNPAAPERRLITDVGAGIGKQTTIALSVRTRQLRGGVFGATLQLPMSSSARRRPSVRGGS